MVESTRACPKSAACRCDAMALLSGCGHDDPASASDVAEDAGCSNIKSIAVPKNWAEYDQAVTCGLDGVRVAVYWSPGGAQASQCLDDDAARCEHAMRTLRERASGP
jgi:hypothetical protein